MPEIVKLPVKVAVVLLDELSPPGPLPMSPPIPVFSTTLKSLAFAEVLTS